MQFNICYCAEFFFNHWLILPPPEISGTRKGEWPHYFATRVYFPTLDSGLASELLWPTECSVNDVQVPKQASRSLAEMFSWNTAPTMEMASANFLEDESPLGKRGPAISAYPVAVCEGAGVSRTEEMPFNPQKNHEKYKSLFLCH